MDCSFKQYANISGECKRKQFLSSCELNEYYLNSQINLLEDSELENNQENRNDNSNLDSINNGHQLRHLHVFFFILFYSFLFYVFAVIN
jgi:hypothetical protein